jgi:hypothetical protein
VAVRGRDTCALIAGWCTSIRPTMIVILTATFGLCLWIVLWAIGIASGFDAGLIVIALVLLAYGVYKLLPYLPGRRS